ncbi:hypothetical protein PAXRUDRAFT_825371, partial [Paxillus rubicundulus Ve08.2h10]
MSGYYVFRSLPHPRQQVPHPSDDPPANHLAEQLTARERDYIATVNLSLSPFLEMKTFA